MRMDDLGDSTANPKCSACGGDGTVLMTPAALGWHNLHGRIWRMTNGHTFEFPGEGREVLVSLCPACYPSHYPDQIHIN